MLVVVAGAAIALVIFYGSAHDVRGTATTEYVTVIHVRPVAPASPWPQWGRAPEKTRVVYVSTLSERTFALDVRTGRRLWSFPDGKYCAGVADARRFYLTRANRVFALTGMAR